MFPGLVIWKENVRIREQVAAFVVTHSCWPTTLAKESQRTLEARTVVKTDDLSDTEQKDVTRLP